jgi:predicted house-cleaning noncanonical NTP pyrophosphatase (MazG superfamily)
MGRPRPNGKLVRDRIPEIIKEDGGDPVTALLSPEEYPSSLMAKLTEEVDELLGDQGDHVAEELADVLEVLTAIAALNGIDWPSVEELRADKRAARGGFEGRAWLGA